MTQYRLISFRVCPFVQRAAIVLHEKGVGSDIEYIDRRAKPASFNAISPLGKVPVLEVMRGQHSPSKRAPPSFLGRALTAPQPA